MAIGTTTAIAAGVMGAGMLGSAAASAEAGRAAGAGAMATAQEARRQSERGEKFGRELMDLVKASPNELMAYERSLTQATNIVERDAKMLDAIDPTLMEASTQALNLIRGQDAAALAPIRKQRGAQREQLVAMLREQLGPGAETSTAGLNALRKFDMETDSLLSSTQQSTLQMFLGAAQNQRAQMPGNIQTLQNVGAGFGQIKNRELNAGTATLNAITTSGQAITGQAGAPFVGQQVAAQGLSAAFNQVGQMGGSMLARGLFPDAKAG